jgi:hypothetical protein
VSTEAVRTGEQLALSIKLTKSLKDGGAETLAAPRLLIQDGKRAMIIVSTGPAAAAAAAGSPPLPSPPLPSPDRTATRRTQETVPAASPEDLESGIRVDVISVKGKDRAIVLTTVMEKGETTWAESKTIDVTVGKAQGKP